MVEGGVVIKTALDEHINNVLAIVLASEKEQCDIHVIVSYVKHSGSHGKQCTSHLLYSGLLTLMRPLAI